MALVKITNRLLTASDEGLICLLVLLDLSAAFDTNDHHILLQRIEHQITIKGSALRWFKSYRSDRCNFLPVNDDWTITVYSITCLPIGNIIRKQSIRFYMDDTK